MTIQPAANLSGGGVGTSKSGYPRLASSTLPLKLDSVMQPNSIGGDNHYSLLPFSGKLPIPLGPDSWREAIKRRETPIGIQLSPIFDRAVAELVIDFGRDLSRSSFTGNLYQKGETPKDLVNFVHSPVTTEKMLLGLSTRVYDYFDSFLLRTIKNSWGVSSVDPLKSFQDEHKLITIGIRSNCIFSKRIALANEIYREICGYIVKMLKENPEHFHTPQVMDPRLNLANYSLGTPQQDG